MCVGKYIGRNTFSNCCLGWYPDYTKSVMFTVTFIIPAIIWLPFSTSNKTQYKPKLNNNKHRKYGNMYREKEYTEKTTTSIQTLELLCKVSKLCYNTIFRWWHLDRRQKHDNIIIVAKSELKCQHYFDVSSSMYCMFTTLIPKSRIVYHICDYL